MRGSWREAQPLGSDALGGPPDDAALAPRRLVFVVPATAVDKKGRLTGPRPWERARTSRAGAHFTAPATRSAKADVVRAAEKAMAGQPLLTGPLSVSLFFVFPARGGGPKAGRPREWKATRPDVDNLEKLVLDALNEVAFDDDGQVVRVFKQKIHGATGEEPRTEVDVEQLVGPPFDWGDPSPERLADLAEEKRIRDEEAEDEARAEAGP